MPDIKLYIVYGSHPCETVMKALELKGLEYKTAELVPPSHALTQRLRFGVRTVPGIIIDGRKTAGSRAILREIEKLVPDPPLLPSDPAERAKVEEAERWGEEVFQPIARRLLWPSFKRYSRAMPSYNAGAKLQLPAPMVRAVAPVATRIEMAMNVATDDSVRADLAELPGHLDRIDAWIAEGVMGGSAPNAADLQIGSTVRLLWTIGDVRPLIDGRPSSELAHRLFPDYDGMLPAGVLPAEWIPAIEAGSPAATSA
jgi:glutathione S-transferase